MAETLSEHMNGSALILQEKAIQLRNTRFLSLMSYLRALKYFDLTYTVCFWKFLLELL